MSTVTPDPLALELAADALHDLWCGDGLSHVGPECPHDRHPGDVDHTQAAAVLDALEGYCL